MFRGPGQGSQIILWKPYFVSSRTTKSAQQAAQTAPGNEAKYIVEDCDTPRNVEESKPLRDPDQAIQVEKPNSLFNYGPSVFHEVKRCSKSD